MSSIMVSQPSYSFSQAWLFFLMSFDFIIFQRQALCHFNSSRNLWQVSSQFPSKLLCRDIIFPPLWMFVFFDLFLSRDKHEKFLHGPWLHQMLKILKLIENLQFFFGMKSSNFFIGQQCQSFYKLPGPGFAEEWAGTNNPLHTLHNPPQPSEIDNITSIIELI